MEKMPNQVGHGENRRVGCARHGVGLVGDCEDSAYADKILVHF